MKDLFKSLMEVTVIDILYYLVKPNIIRIDEYHSHIKTKKGNFYVLRKSLDTYIVVSTEHLSVINKTTLLSIFIDNLDKNEIESSLEKAMEKNIPEQFLIKLPNKIFDGETPEQILFEIDMKTSQGKDYLVPYEIGTTSKDNINEIVLLGKTPSQNILFLNIKSNQSRLLNNKLSWYSSPCKKPENVIIFPDPKYMHDYVFNKKEFDLKTSLIMPFSHDTILYNLLLKEYPTQAIFFHGYNDLKSFYSLLNILVALSIKVNGELISIKAKGNDIYVTLRYDHILEEIEVEQTVGDLLVAVRDKIHDKVKTIIGGDIGTFKCELISENGVVYSFPFKVDFLKTFIDDMLITPLGVKKEGDFYLLQVQN